MISLSYLPIQRLDQTLSDTGPAEPSPEIPKVKTTDSLSAVMIGRLAQIGIGIPTQLRQSKGV